MNLYIEGLDKGKKTRNGELYYEQFKDFFWKKGGKFRYLLF